jgi:hypothetical protein
LVLRVAMAETPRKLKGWDPDCNVTVEEKEEEEKALPDSVSEGSTPMGTGIEG